MQPYLVILFHAKFLLSLASSQQYFSRMYAYCNVYRFIEHILKCKRFANNLEWGLVFSISIMNRLNFKLASDRSLMFSLAELAVQ